MNLLAAVHNSKRLNADFGDLQAMETNLIALDGTKYYNYEKNIFKKDLNETLDCITGC
jgi:hypothetical protein